MFPPFQLAFKMSIKLRCAYFALYRWKINEKNERKEREYETDMRGIQEGIT
jgi:hypothetical protein